MQAQPEPKLHPERANMELEQVITILKDDLKFNLEPTWIFEAWFLQIPCKSCRQQSERKHTEEQVKTWAFCVILPGDPLFPSKKLFMFQVCGAERTETKAPLQR